MKERSIPRIILSNISGLIFFLILIALANYALNYFSHPTFVEVVNFLNSNLALIITISILGLFSDLFWAFIFPFNIIAPILSAFLSYYILSFVYTILELVQQARDFVFPISFNTLYPFVFAIVIIIGYIIIFSRLGRKLIRKEDNEEKPEKKKRSQKEAKVELIKWEKVGNEFRLLFLNIAKSLNNLFAKKKKRK
jgi:hypothetical protein